jgi:malate synthase
MAELIETPIKHKLQVKAPILPHDERVFTTGAVNFLTALHTMFNSRRIDLLKDRRRRQQGLDHGNLPDFLSETSYIREQHWNIAPLPEALQDRRVEITGPVDRKMIINALNSGAKVFMADFEDSTSPTWRNIVEGQFNLMDAVRNTISYQTDEKIYTLNDTIASIHVRPRGWHLDEKHIEIDGEPMSASLLDFGLFVYHNGELLSYEKRGPFFYLPKLESHHEARLWNDVFLFSEKELGIPRGTIKATVLIETILAVFEMDEIIYELREHMAGLNAGRWDYIFSMIKKFKNHKAFLTPDRSAITMAVPFMSAYAQLLVKTCHRRGAHAMGGMSAFIPSKDETVNKKAFEKVIADKVREASYGYDGTWVAHPKLVPIAQSEFDTILGTSPHQKNILCTDVHVSASDLLDVASAGNSITEKGVRTNINVALLYIESWLRGVGAAALHNLMEDAATAEISRAQLWQWVHHNAVLNDGRIITKELYEQVEKEEMDMLVKQFISEGHSLQNLTKAKDILHAIVIDETFEDFLTLPMYQHID